MIDTVPGDIGLVVPYAGPAGLLVETVTSVLAQTDDCWQLVVVEDGDQDASVEPWLEQLGDRRISYHRNHTTLGVAGNFQRCLELATTDFVAFPGSDDRLGKDYVAVLRRAIAAFGQVAVIQPGVRVIDAAGQPTRPLGDRIKARLAPRRGTRVLSGEPLLSSLMHGNWAYFPSLCWRRELLVTEGFRQDLSTVLDLELLARLILDDARLLVLPDPVFEYRRHGGSASALAAHRTDRFEEERLVMAEIAAAARARGWPRASRAARLRATSRLHATMVLAAAVSGKDWPASRALWTHAVRR